MVEDPPEDGASRPNSRCPRAAGPPIMATAAAHAYAHCASRPAHHPKRVLYDLSMTIAIGVITLDAATK
ncbi:hypothetical protein [Streptantibioticus ferralitis]|uniref:Uncharacterized protein n=1 Tax=Streptantibioticus ferralitis TaxID=236510 RepID=A0ABT5YW79_9ACTN|nr:hypothetical protein [Streptantibioticus ferralitis]MDF2255753.1 hypothetical protein [Streptantibioticus ferralitis]